MRERTRLEFSLNTIHEMEAQLLENLEFIELGEIENDEEVVLDAEASVKELHARAQTAELQTLLSGEADTNDC